MNKNFSIRGHLRRGDEVIKILEMLGGKTSYECSYKDGFDSSYFFFINHNSLMKMRNLQQECQ